MAYPSRRHTSVVGWRWPRSSFASLIYLYSSYSVHLLGKGEVKLRGGGVNNQLTHLKDAMWRFFIRTTHKVISYTTQSFSRGAEFGSKINAWSIGNSLTWPVHSFTSTILILQNVTTYLTLQWFEVVGNNSSGGQCGNCGESGLFLMVWWPQGAVSHLQVDNCRNFDIFCRSWVLACRGEWYLTAQTSDLFYKVKQTTK